MYHKDGTSKDIAEPGASLLLKTSLKVQKFFVHSPSTQTRLHILPMSNLMNTDSVASCWKTNLFRFCPPLLDLYRIQQFDRAQSQLPLHNRLLRHRHPSWLAPGIEQEVENGTRFCQCKTEFTFCAKSKMECTFCATLSTLLSSTFPCLALSFLAMSRALERKPWSMDDFYHPEMQQPMSRTQLNKV